MFALSQYERQSVRRRALLLEMELRRLHLDEQLPASAKLERWKTLFRELKSLRELGASARRFGKPRTSPTPAVASA